MILCESMAPTDRAPPAQAAAPCRRTAGRLADRGGRARSAAVTGTLAQAGRNGRRAEDGCLWLRPDAAGVVEPDGAHVLAPGDACRATGAVNTRHAVTRPAETRTYLRPGTRAPADRVRFAGIDKIYTRPADGTVTRTRRDGSRLT